MISTAGEPNDIIITLNNKNLFVRSKDGVQVSTEVVEYEAPKQIDAVLKVMGEAIGNDVKTAGESMLIVSLIMKLAVS